MKDIVSSSDLPDWNFTTSQIENIFQQKIKYAHQKYQKIKKINPTRLSFDNLFLPLYQITENHDLFFNKIGLLGSVSPQKKIQKKCIEVEEKASQIALEIAKDEKLYQQIMYYYQHQYKKEKKKLSTEDKKIIEETIQGYQRSGMNIKSDSKKEKLKNIQSQIIKLQNKFQNNISSDNSTITLTSSELKGLSTEIKDKLVSSDTKSKNKKYQLPLTYPFYFPAMKMITSSETRKKMMSAFDSRAKKDNLDILKKLVLLRQQQAKLLGYASHVDYQTEVLMAKKNKNVNEFLTSLSNTLLPIYKKELKLLHSRVNLPKNKKIESWDLSYYLDQDTKKRHKIDYEKIKEYFPLTVVKNGMFKLYQKLFGVTFKKIDDLPEKKTWHSEASAYGVIDESNKSLLGYFYFDLFPRDDKFNHAACFTIQNGYITTDKKKSIPITAMVCNFSTPTKKKPSLLSLGEIRTLFHEFGHALHNIFGHTQRIDFSGTSVLRDFVEAPSQMLENWLKYPDILQDISSHYITSKKIPTSLIKTIISAQQEYQSFGYVRQVMLATLDNVIHSHPKFLAKLNNDTYSFQDLLSYLSDVFLNMSPAPDSNMMSAFGHLGGGYDARYYGYLWSKCIASDMFITKFKGDMKNSDMGIKYRESILQPGGSQEPDKLIKKFLGRKFKTKYLLQDLLNNQIN